MLVRFKRWGVFFDTFQPYREWIFESAQPEFDAKQGFRLLEVAPGSRGDPTGVTKRYWDGCRFQVREPDAENGSGAKDLEEWQVVKIFDGDIPPWPMEGMVMEEVRCLLMGLMPAGKGAIAAVLAMTATMAKDIAKKAPDAPEVPALTVGGDAILDFVRQSFPKRPRGNSRDELEHSYVFVASEAIPDTMIEKGDVVLYRWTGYNPDSKVVGATFHRVPKSQQYAVYHHFKSLRMIHDGIGRGAESVYRRMGRSCGQEDHNSRTIVLRRRVPRCPACQTIEAASDDAALFELLAQVGGRMPAKVVHA